MMANLVTASKDKPGHIATKTAKVNEKVCTRTLIYWHCCCCCCYWLAVVVKLLLLLLLLLLPLLQSCCCCCYFVKYCHMLCIYCIMHCRCIMCSVVLCCIVAILGSWTFYINAHNFLFKTDGYIFIFCFLFLFCLFVCLFVLTKWSNPNSSSSSFNVSKPIFLFHNALVHKAYKHFSRGSVFLDGTP